MVQIFAVHMWDHEMVYKDSCPFYLKSVHPQKGLKVGHRMNETFLIQYASSFFL